MPDVFERIYIISIILHISSSNIVKKSWHFNNLTGQTQGTKKTAMDIKTGGLTLGFVMKIN